ncbi:MAG: transcriptional regulator [Proteobacteria bacterium]|nr:transcriptional regulator [Pseudomonadota bacterium]
MSARILIIEDEATIAEMIGYALRADRFEAVWCATGAAGLAELSQAPVDLVILDIGLPDTNGFDLFHQLQATTPAPVIFLTARSAEIDRVAGLELGADDYVTKPFSPRELMARVRSVLRRAKRDPQRESVPESDALPLPFAVDDDKRRIRYFGRPLELTRYEYGLLRVLVRRPGRVFSRDELLGQVWEVPEESYDRTVDAHIKTLRAKLRSVKPELEAIRTHRGLGYALSDDW